MNYTIDKDVLHELTDIIEDSVEFFCDEYKVSGELTWILIESLAQAKLRDFGDERFSFIENT